MHNCRLDGSPEKRLAVGLEPLFEDKMDEEGRGEEQAGAYQEPLYLSIITIDNKDLLRAKESDNFLSAKLHASSFFSFFF